ncbi:MAG: FAD-dependent oxidoreductase [Thermoleophilia bacterium]|nr:FAD-dependent oxidoreductase [Thermoleophilia bacterium]
MTVESPSRRLGDDLSHEWDVLIVGAGIGGLTAAGHLAMAGRRVLVLEQDRHVGGTAHVFRRRDFVFPAGPLSFTVPASLARTLRELGTTTQALSFERDVFQVRRDDLDVIISMPLSRLEAQLTGAFSAEAVGLRSVFAVLREVVGALRRLRPADLGAEPPLDAAGAWSQLAVS